MNKDPTVYLQHILESIELVETYAEGLTKEEFLCSREKQDSITRRIEIVGEAVRHLSWDLRHQYPQVPWQKIAGTRDKLIHQYFSIDLELVWDVVQRDLPVLKEQVTRMLKQLS